MKDNNQNEKNKDNSLFEDFIVPLLKFVDKTANNEYSNESLVSFSESINYYHSFLENSIVLEELPYGSLKDEFLKEKRDRIKEYYRIAFFFHCLEGNDNKLNNPNDEEFKNNKNLTSLTGSKYQFAAHSAYDNSIQNNALYKNDIDSKRKMEDVMQIFRLLSQDVNIGSIMRVSEDEGSSSNIKQLRENLIKKYSEFESYYNKVGDFLKNKNNISKLKKEMQFYLKPTELQNEINKFISEHNIKDYDSTDFNRLNNIYKIIYEINNNSLSDIEKDKKIDDLKFEGEEFFEGLAQSFSEKSSHPSLLLSKLDGIIKFINKYFLPKERHIPLYKDKYASKISKKGKMLFSDKGKLKEKATAKKAVAQKQKKGQKKK